MAKQPTYEELVKRVKKLEAQAAKSNQVVKTLRASEHKFKEIFDNVNDAIYLLRITEDGLPGQFVEVNDVACQGLGYSKDEFMSMSPLDISAPGKTKDWHKKNMTEMLSRGHAIFEWVNVAKNGTKIPVEISARIFKVDHENIIFSIARDISERKRAENALRESKRFLSAVFDTIQDGISVLDPEMDIISVNQAMRKWYAHMLPLEGKKCYEAYHKRDKACEICPTKRALKSGRLEVNEVPLVQAKGMTGTIELFAFPMLDDSGKVTGVVEYVRDITDRKRAEEALKESAEKIKLFAYSVAHDLKNPAVAISLLTEALQKKYKDILDEKGKNYCEHILKSSKLLATLVEQINIYISTKEVPLILERVNLKRVFDTVRKEFSAQIKDRQITWLQPENGTELNGDRLSILRAMGNFVDNSLKYGGDELTKIELGHEESDEFHILSVKDDGIGIDEGNSENIFSLFQRAVTSKGIEGAGLGLAIANEIANQHKGHVWAEPRLKKGITFYISISKGLSLTH